MSDFPLVISFYTLKTLYQLEVQNLIASCKQFDLEAEIEGVKSFGSWELNCAYKPFFILGKLQELKRPVLWVDADAVFVQRPIWEDYFNADLAVRIETSLPYTHPSKVMSGTLYVNYTPEAMGVLRDWIAECQKQLTDLNRKEEFWDQIALRNVLQRQTAAKIHPLPPAYVKIFDHPSDPQNEPIITHYQASRRLKKTV